jgi:hypothetical protein
MIGGQPDGTLAQFSWSIQGILSNVLLKIYQQQIKGLSHVWDWTKGSLLTAQAGFGRTIHYLSQRSPGLKPAFGVDIGGGSVKIAAAYQDELLVSAFTADQWPGNRLSQGGILKPDDVYRWVVSPEIGRAGLIEYLANRRLYPASLPVTVEELAIEEAIQRRQMQTSLTHLDPILPDVWPAGASGGLNGFEPVVAAGSSISAAPSLAHACLTLLDGLQPQGITTLMIDQHNLAGVLGALLDRHPELVEQLVDSGSFAHLGTVIAPVGNAASGTPVLQVELVRKEQPPVKMTIKQGALETLPLPYGQTARLLLQPFQRYDLGMGGPGRGGELRVTGSALGVVIDCRGRPLSLHDDLARRNELYKKWIWTMGG